MPAQITELREGYWEASILEFWSMSKLITVEQPMSISTLVAIQVLDEQQIIAQWLPPVDSSTVNEELNYFWIRIALIFPGTPPTFLLEDDRSVGQSRCSSTVLPNTADLTLTNSKGPRPTNLVIWWQRESERRLQTVPSDTLRFPLVHIPV